MNRSIGSVLFPVATVAATPRASRKSKSHSGAGLVQSTCPGRLRPTS